MRRERNPLLRPPGGILTSRQHKPILRLDIRKKSRRLIDLTRFPLEVRNEILRYVFSRRDSACDTDPIKKEQDDDESVKEEQDDAESIKGEDTSEPFNTPLTTGSASPQSCQSEEIASNFERSSTPSSIDVRPDPYIYAIDGREVIVLYDLDQKSDSHIEDYIFNDQMILLECGQFFFPRDIKIVTCARKLHIRFDEGPLLFKELVYPILVKRTDIKYLCVEFAYWPPYGMREIPTYDAQKLGMMKLNFLTSLGAQEAVLHFSGVGNSAPWPGICTLIATKMMAKSVQQNELQASM